MCDRGGPAQVDAQRVDGAKDAPWSVGKGLAVGRGAGKDELVTWVPGGRGRSPNRVDALVHVVAELTRGGGDVRARVF